MPKFVKVIARTGTRRLTKRRKGKVVSGKRRYVRLSSARRGSAGAGVPPRRSAYRSGKRTGDKR